MKAAIYQEFAKPLSVENVDDPVLPQEGVIISVKATGLCRSDWHGWMGHDPDIKLPHIPGHELAGEIVAVGKAVTGWKVGDRVTLPFVCGCGHCRQCLSGNQQVCDHQFQPGFTHWGSFAELVTIHQAQGNLVALPEELDFVTAASLGCRFATAFRAVVDQAKVSAGQSVAIYGCGGVGLSAIMIANALGANVVAIDLAEDKLEFARSIGAATTLNASARTADEVVQAVREITGGGAHVSLDALGSVTTCFNSIASLRKRGKHIQVGLMLGDQHHPPVPMDRVIANELEILGSHGMQAYRYDTMLQMIQNGKLQPGKLVGRTISLAEAATELTEMNNFRGLGVTVINQF